MAVVLLYVTFGMLTTVLVSFIGAVLGDEPPPWKLVSVFFCWPVALVVLFVYALEGSE